MAIFHIRMTILLILDFGIWPIVFLHLDLTQTGQSLLAESCTYAVQIDASDHDTQGNRNVFTKENPGYWPYNVHGLVMDPSN